MVILESMEEIIQDEREREEQERIESKYNELFPNYERLCINLKNSIICLLQDNNIAYLDVQSRVKEFTSFFEKISLKHYCNPFNDIEDLAGIRIICFYPSDIDIINNLIKKHFNILSEENKLDKLDDDKFGYRSTHFILKVKEEWLCVPNFKGLESLKVELQVRTILMHAWADVSHKLLYKKEADVPKPLRRELNLLSAVFELADKQFERLRQERNNYIETLTEQAKINGFDLTQEINVDSIQAFLNFYFSDREKSFDGIPSFIEEMQRANITFDALVDCTQKLEPLLNGYEMEYRKLVNDEWKWTQLGIIRLILDISNDKFSQSRKVTTDSKYGKFVIQKRVLLKKASK